MATSGITRTVCATGNVPPQGVEHHDGLHRLPFDLLPAIFASAGKTHKITKTILDNVTLDRNDEWAAISPRLREDRLIAAYIDALGLEDIPFTGHERFMRLFHAMTGEIGVPDSIKLISRFSAECYCRLSQELKDISLKRAWRQIRTHPRTGYLPTDDVRAIRAWLDNPANRRLIDEVIGLDLAGCNLLVIPDEIKVFTNLNVLYLERNKIRVVCPQQFERFHNLESLYLSSNCLTTLPEGVFRGLVNLSDLNLSNNGITGLTEALFRDLRNLQWLYLSSNRIGHLPRGIFQGLSQLENLFLFHNLIDDLPEGIFEGLVRLELLSIHQNRSEFPQFGSAFLDLGAQAKIAAMRRYYNPVGKKRNAAMGL